MHVNRVLTVQECLTVVQENEEIRCTLNAGSSAVYIGGGGNIPLLFSLCIAMLCVKETAAIAISRMRCSLFFFLWFVQAF